QDSKGNIWICTDAGVTKYDGFYFKTYTVNDGLIDNVVFDFYEDQWGKIWFLSYNSRLCYLENGKIVSYKYNDIIDKFTSLKTAGEKVLYLDNKKNLYYSIRYSGLLKISKDGNWEQLHKNKNSLCLKRIDEQYMLSLRNDYVIKPKKNTV
ncbi:MAG: hypothetical protein JKY09_00330, partial [Crocinitomicaceae bacterium]|nr:hypothetical protein [Crocinitomicaceae bacterium]